jgi:hypothetical protein
VTTAGPVDLPLPQETLQETAQRMTVAFNGLCEEFAANNRELRENTEELREQKKYGRHTRFGLWVALASLVIDLPITLLLFVSYNNSQDAVHLANKAAQTAAHTAQEDLYTNCIKGNTTREEQISLFDDILVAVAPTIGPAETTKFAALIQTTFAPRNCDKLKPKPKAASDTALVQGSLGIWSQLMRSSSVNLPQGKTSSRLLAVPATSTPIIPSPGP